MLKTELTADKSSNENKEEMSDSSLLSEPSTRDAISYKIYIFDSKIISAPNFLKSISEQENSKEYDINVIISESLIRTELNNFNHIGEDERLSAAINAIMLENSEKLQHAIEGGSQKLANLSNPNLDDINESLNHTEIAFQDTVGLVIAKTRDNQWLIGQNVTVADDNENNPPLKEENPKKSLSNSLAPFLFGIGMVGLAGGKVPVAGKYLLQGARLGANFVDAEDNDVVEKFVCTGAYFMAQSAVLKYGITGLSAFAASGVSATGVTGGLSLLAIPLSMEGLYHLGKFSAFVASQVKNGCHTMFHLNEESTEIPTSIQQALSSLPMIRKIKDHNQYVFEQDELKIPQDLENEFKKLAIDANEIQKTDEELLELHQELEEEKKKLIAQDEDYKKRFEMCQNALNQRVAVLNNYVERSVASISGYLIYDRKEYKSRMAGLQKEIDGFPAQLAAIEQSYGFGPNAPLPSSDTYNKLCEKFNTRLDQSTKMKSEFRNKYESTTTNLQKWQAEEQTRRELTQKNALDSVRKSSEQMREMQQKSEEVRRKKMEDDRKMEEARRKEQKFRDEQFRKSQEKQKQEMEENRRKQMEFQKRAQEQRARDEEARKRRMDEESKKRKDEASRVQRSSSLSMFSSNTGSTISSGSVTHRPYNSAANGSNKSYLRIGIGFGNGPMNHGNVPYNKK